MAHPQQKEYCLTVKQRHPEFFTNKRVLDIGSLDVNGSFRDMFKDCEYIGVDIHDGKGVDVVSKGHEYKSEDKFDVVCSGECFEHDKYWELTFMNMYEHLKDDGLLFFTCATIGRPEHGTTRTGSPQWGSEPDYYMNLSEADFREAFDIHSMFKDYEFKLNPLTRDLYFKGIKNG